VLPVGTGGTTLRRSRCFQCDEVNVPSHLAEFAGEKRILQLDFPGQLASDGGIAKASNFLA
jgi:hypothetical protein